MISLVFSGGCNAYSYSVNEGSGVSVCAVLEYINGSVTLMNDLVVQFKPTSGTAVGKLHVCGGGGGGGGVEGWG